MNAADQDSQQTKLTLLVTELFQDYHVAIFAYVYRMVEDRELAHDLTQETFLKVFHTRRRLPQIENPRAWIYRIATNTTLNALKRQNLFTRFLQRQTEPTAPNPTDHSDQRIDLEHALAELPIQYRMPLLLYSVHGFSVREVADALDITEGATKTRLHRAREMFRQAYEKGAKDG